MALAGRPITLDALLMLRLVSNSKFMPLENKKCISIQALQGMCILAALLLRRICFSTPGDKCSATLKSHWLGPIDFLLRAISTSAGKQEKG